MLTARHAAIRLLKFMMVASIVLPAVLFAFAATLSYRNFEHVTDERIDRSLDILHEHALKVLQTVERSFAEIDEIVRNMSDDDIRNNEDVLHARLLRIVASLPQLQGIAIMDRAGHPLVTSSAMPAPRQTDFSDRDFFKAQAADNPGTFVSDIHAPRMGSFGPYFFALSQRRPSADGQFNGVVTVALLPKYFEDFYARMSTSDRSYFALARADGTFLARVPVPKDRRAKLGPNSQLHAGIARGLERSIYTVNAQVDQIERRIGYRKLAGFPLYALAGVETSAITAEWMSYMSGHLLFGFPLTVFLFAGLWLALRRTQRLYDEADRREMAEGALRQAQRLEAYRPIDRRRRARFQ